MGDTSDDLHQYWNSFYESRISLDVPDAPSPFAEWVHRQIPAGQSIVEFGFGTGRDSLWFARSGRPVVGFDFAESAVEAAQRRAAGEALGATFARLDLYDAAAVAATAIGDDTEPANLYCRFLIHSLTDRGRWNLFDLAAVTLATGGRLYLEFRTGDDVDGNHLFGDDHFRKYLEPSVVAAELDQRGATVMHSEAGHGLAVYKTEDPHVARIVATWR